MSHARAVAAALALAAAFAAGVAAQAPDADRQQRERDAAQRLEAVREQIATLTREQQAREDERSAASRALREADQEVAAGAGALREIDAALLAQQQELERLEREQQLLRERLAAQRETLAQLLRSAYALGRHEQLKLLLAQDRVDELARVLAYHRYFERDRVARIDALLGELRTLAELGRAVLAQREALAAARAQQEARIAALDAQRGERRLLLRTLEKQFADARERLAALGRDERVLLRLLESLRDVFADIPQQLEEAKPFAQRRGSLPLPLAGRVLAAYGGTLPDGRASQGWLIEGKAGANVSAVAPGRVAFADWLKGYGLLLIVDHGDGYMSLYAQNDSLLKEAGDWVAAGDAIAGVGTSGGQQDAALYFELRADGQPVDPKKWLLPR